jgi:hypothetical protein
VLQPAAVLQSVSCNPDATRITIPFAVIPEGNLRLALRLGFSYSGGSWCNLEPPVYGRELSPGSPGYWLFSGATA